MTDATQVRPDHEEDLEQKLQALRRQGDAEIAGVAPGEAAKKREADDDDATDETLLERLGDFASENWHLVLIAVAAVGLVIFVGLLILRSGSGAVADATSTKAAAPAKSQPAAAEGSGGQAAPVAAVRAEDTKVAFGVPKQKGDDYYLEAGQIAWKGRLEKTKDGEVLTLEGPTAAQFKRAVQVAGGDITTGVFGRAEPGKPLVHATFHRTTIGDREVTQGTYSVVGEDAILLSGTYTDQRSGDDITRTYTENVPGAPPEEAASYAVKFKAPMGVPIPALVGWKAPEDQGPQQVGTSSSGDSSAPETQDAPAR
jgi:hypothetical protein